MSIMPHLLRYRELAVVHYSGIPCALHLPREIRLDISQGSTIAQFRWNLSPGLFSGSEVFAIFNALQATIP